MCISDKRFTEEKKTEKNVYKDYRTEYNHGKCNMNFHHHQPLRIKSYFVYAQVFYTILSFIKKAVSHKVLFIIWSYFVIKAT